MRGAGIPFMALFSSPSGLENALREDTCSLLSSETASDQLFCVGILGKNGVDHAFDAEVNDLSRPWWAARQVRFASGSLPTPSSHH